MKISRIKPGLIIFLFGIVQCLSVSGLFAAEEGWSLAVGAKYHQTVVHLMDDKLKDEIRDINKEHFGKDEEDFYGCGTKIPEFNNGGPFCLTIFSETQFDDSVISPSISLYLPDHFLGDSQFGIRSILTYGTFQTNEQYIPIYDGWEKNPDKSYEARDIGTSIETNYLMFTPTIFYSFFGKTPPYMRLGAGVGIGLIRIEGTFANSYITTYNTDYKATGIQRGETISFSNDTTLMAGGLFLEFKAGIFSINLEVQGVSKQIGESEFSYEFVSSSATLLVDIY